MTIREIIQSTILIAIIAFIAAFALSHINDVTRPAIQEQEKEKQENALSVVFPGYQIQDKKNVSLDGKDFVYWTAKKKERGTTLNAFAFIASQPGYSGDIRVMVGVNEKDEILGLSILSQTETPGLGARCTEVASTETFFGYIFGDLFGSKKIKTEKEPSRPWFQEQFTGLSVDQQIEIVKKGDWQPSMREQLREKNAITTITGATITTKTVRDAITKGIGKLHQARNKSSDGRTRAQ
ncbi:MAG TPA: FMN-binding protein [Spirochaetota bacterium]|nr:FMN-binding protein [Spirochaetota bacterium]